MSSITKKEENTSPTFKSKVLPFLREQGSAAAGLIILFIIMSVASSNFLTMDNLVNVMRQISINAILAVGMTFVIITAGIDLSVGAVIALTGTLWAATVVNYNMPIWVGILLALIIGGLLGVVKGLIISTQNLPPFIVTLAMLTIISGLSFVFTGGRPISVNTDAFKMIGRGYIGPIPIPVIIMIIVVIAGHYLLKKTAFGRHVLAVGGNPEAARLCGVKVTSVIVKVYALAGVLTALAGIILSSRLASGSPTVGDGAELDAIAAVVLGGTNMMGGSGSILGTCIGVGIIGILGNGLNLLGVSSYNQMIIKGLVMLFAIWINNLKLKKAKSN
ncbi:ribose ABC transporter permease [Clostridioides mangenotii]|uniref:ABC transporter permease n=1 Tax=Metaclostridioides mangenotii TaxID=1540 RepID=UPI002149DD63|nr:MULTISPECIES: ribose ABC transporter permease [Clostridioides]MBS5786935.1 ribose ABC transporter permease [Clostridioides difficile]MCR1953933.1 ribose ABC transporter permease [Clostridioides mangenotii]